QVFCKWPPWTLAPLMRQFLDALPVRIAFGRPSRPELFVLVGVLLLLASGASLGWLAWPSKPAVLAPDPGVNSELEVSASAPSGASLLVDDQAHGRVPTVVALAPGLHTVTVQAPDAIPETHQVEVTRAGTHLDLSLWRSHPTVQYLRPPL